MKFLKLNRANMRTLPVGGEIIEHGVRYKKLPNGDGRFTIDLMVNRKRIHRVIGTEADGVTREQCEMIIEKFKTEAREDRLKLPKGRKLALLFEAMANKYLLRMKEKDDADYRNKEQRLRNHLIPFFRDHTLPDITEWDIERYKSQRKKATVINRERLVSPATINRELSVLSHLINCAISWKWIDHAPCKIEKEQEEEKKKVYLTSEQCTRLLDAAMAHENPHILPFIYIALSTAMRAGEIYSIRIENIDLDRLNIFLPKAKAGARNVPISSDCAEFLKSYISADQEWLFPTIGTRSSKTGHTVNLRQPFDECVKTAGLETDEIVRHTLRHTAISHLVLAGVDLPTVKAISGHKTDRMLYRYSHRNSEHLTAAMDKLSFRTTTQEFRRPKSVKAEKLAPGRT